MNAMTIARNPVSPDVERAISEAAELSERIGKRHPTTFTHTLRDDFTLRYMSIAQEHREAIILLIRHGARSSAFALARSVYEACMRGLWMQFAATDQQIDTFLRTKVLPGFDAMMRQMSQSQQAPQYSSVKQQAYERLSDFSHGGWRQLARWSSDTSIEPVHPDQEVVHLLVQLDGWAILACIGAYAAAKLPTESLQDLADQLRTRTDVTGGAP